MISTRCEKAGLLKNLSAKTILSKLLTKTPANSGLSNNIDQVTERMDMMQVKMKSGEDEFCFRPQGCVPMHSEDRGKNPVAKNTCAISPVTQQGLDKFSIRETGAISASLQNPTHGLRSNKETEERSLSVKILIFLTQ